MRVLTGVLALALLAAAQEPQDLLYLGLNKQGAEEWYRIRDGATVIRVPGGAYQRRPYEGGVAVKEPVAVHVASFFVDKYEVTNARFARFLNAYRGEVGFVDTRVAGLQRTAKGWRATPGLERHPVTAANGHGALAYAKWVGGAVPTPAQWEKAAGGTEGRTFPWGDAAPDLTRANFAAKGLRGPAPVGSFAAGVSPYGCHDMAGNVYERVHMGGRGPVMIKGGAWLSPHPLNLRVADMCVQAMAVSDRSVGFRCVMKDPEPDRAPRKAKPAATIRWTKSWQAATAEAIKRKVPIFLTLQFDTCGQCDRTRAQLFRDPRFVAYVNRYMVAVVGHRAAPQPGVDNHDENEDGTCPLYPGIECLDHHEVFAAALKVVKVFQVSPGNFVLTPDGVKVLIPERDLPKWGNPVEAYLAAFERARTVPR